MRAAVVWELLRLRREQPDLGAWEKPEVKTGLRQTAVWAWDMDTDLPMGAATYLGVGLGVELPGGNGKAEGTV